MKKHIRVLIVDDSPEVAEILALSLGYEFSVRSATSFEEALKLLDSEPFTDLLSDLCLGNKCGLDILHYAQKRYPAIHRYLMSGAFPSLLEKHLASGTIKRFFNKPPDIQEIVRQINQANFASVKTMGMAACL